MLSEGCTYSEPTGRALDKSGALKCPEQLNNIFSIFTTANQKGNIGKRTKNDKISVNKTPIHILFMKCLEEIKVSIT